MEPQEEPRGTGGDTAGDTAGATGGTRGGTADGEVGGEAGGMDLESLSLPARIVTAAALAVATVAAGIHVGMVFLHVAPSNAVSQRHGEAIDSYVYPEFEQNWKLFAPNPLQSNIAVHARAELRKDDGSKDTTEWIDLTAMDGERIRGNLAPSHTAQNELRRAWDFFTGSHDSDNKANGLRGELSERYLRRIVMNRFGPELDGGTVQRIQLRSATRRVAAPPWSEENINTDASYRVLPWWVVSTQDLQPEDGADTEASAR